MSIRGSKVERRSVSDQPYELKFEAHKLGVKKEDVAAAKQATDSNQRKAVEQELKDKK